MPTLVQRPLVYRPRTVPTGGVDGLLAQEWPALQSPAPAVPRAIETEPERLTDVEPTPVFAESMPIMEAVIPVPERRKRKSSVPYLHRFIRLPKSRLQTTLAVMAILVFGLGVFVNIQTMLANRSNSAQVSALSKKSDSGSSTNDENSSVAVPSTTKPTAKAVASYVVAPNYPRYLIIPKLGVDARVTQVGVTSSGALGTPNNVYDTAWYTGSAEPGQPGAVLIDGHVSSWTSKGVFYGIHTLVAGDKIQIQRGDGTMFNYQVVKTTVYPSGNVDMQSAIMPITPGKSGLNLITCTGQVIKGTSLFNERVIVYAEQI